MNGYTWAKLSTLQNLIAEVTDDFVRLDKLKDMTLGDIIEEYSKKGINFEFSYYATLKQRFKDEQTT